MKAASKFTIILVLLLIAITGCSRKKDKFISRNFHAVTTEFNILYNGSIALEEGRKRLNDNYFDNYWEVLPIERMQIFDEIVLPGQSKNENFTRAEEKAVLAIQKHSMNIESKERNPQIDEAYLLLGKARYFDQRFVPALEAFNHILYKYATSDKINQAKVWREKTNIRLDNNELAIVNLKRLLKQEQLEDQDLADATSILAQAYLNTKSIDSAITQLDIAANHTKSNDEVGRYRFIQGQLYNKLGKKDSANYAFDRVIELNRKTPRIYMIDAHIEKIKNFDYENGDKVELLEFLNKLEEVRENRPFLDKIYHQIGQFYLKTSSDSSAVAYYNKSLRTNSKDNVLMARNYEILGDMNFDASIYAQAGAYFDSTMSKLKLNSKPFRVIKRKRDNLEDVIHYEQIAKVNDSILHLVNLPETERLSYFESFVEKLKTKADQDAKRQKVAARNKGLATANNNIGGKQINTPRGGLPGQATASFYFYNPTTVAYGKNEFIKVWGSRTLEDNWRWSVKKSIAAATSNTLNSALTVDAPDDELFDPQFYISKIPSAQKEIDSLSKDRNYAYYQLGLIYKEKFKEYELAKHKFQNLLKSNPEERLILPSKYNLYKIYELLGANDEASITKNDIVKTYPTSRYATILINPELASLKDENSAASLYESIYALHNEQKYAQVIAKCDEYINTFDGESIVPKFELLKATASGRLKGFEVYKALINNLAVKHANTPEGKQSQHIARNVLPRVANKEFVNDSVVDHVKVVYRFKNSETEKRIAFNKALDSVLSRIKYYKLNTSVDVYDENETFILVHGLKNIKVAKVFEQLFNEEDKLKIKEPYFVITSANYQIIQIHKNLELYLNKDNN